jgi:predicted dehydrogenase
MTKAGTSTTRREVLKGAAMATVSAAFWYPSGRVLGANDRVNLAIVGIRGQGLSHIKGFPKIANVNIKTFCDIDENNFAERLQYMQETHKYAPGTATDMRKVFEDKEIDAVTFAIPNHWHALASIWAVQGGKHVYVEKPACHTVWEGRQMVNASRKYKRLIQVGFQNRSRNNTNAAMKFLHEEKLGKVYKARGLCFKSRDNIGRYPDGPMAADAKPIPMVKNKAPYTASYLEKVHYDMWMGPAPAKPFNPNRFHYNWHWQWDYGGGDTANQGPHQFDVARWGLNRKDDPVKVRSFGGLYLYQNSQQETPNDQTSIFEYADGTILEFGTRGLLTNAEGKQKIGVIFYCEKGRLEIDANGKWQTYLGSDDKPGPNSDSIKEEEADALNTVGTGSNGHYANFVQAVRSGKQEDLTCDIEVGFKSSVLPLIANISYRVGRDLKWDGKKEQFVGDAQANKLLKRNDRKGYVIPNLGGTTA